MMANKLPCAHGIPDCVALCEEGLWGNGQCTPDNTSNFPGCSPYAMNYQDTHGNYGLFIPAIMVAAMMAFGIGANDSANNWATSVGSGAVSLRSACIIGGLFEWLGAVCLGYGVSSTIQKGVSKLQNKQGMPYPDCWACGFCDSQMPLYTAGMFGSLVGASIFLLLATFTSMPVSTTHAIVGGVVGVTMVGALNGPSCLNWKLEGGLGGIVLSWVISPLLSGFIGFIVFHATDQTIFKTARPDKNALKAFPFLCGFSIFCVVSVIFLKSPATKKRIAVEYMFLIAAGCALITIFFAYFFVIPRIQNHKYKIDEMDQNIKDFSIEEKDELQTKNKKVVLEENTQEQINTMEPIEIKETEKHKARAQYPFLYLLVLIGSLGSFAHGANDTANATGPLAAIVLSFNSGKYDCGLKEAPLWIMIGAGFFVFLGINIAGSRVIKTMGEEITSINYHRGFCIQFSATTTVVLATVLGFPVSTTHCQVGAVVFVGLTALGKDNVSWSLFRKIVLSWVITLPLSGGTAALFLIIMKQLISL